MLDCNKDELVGLFESLDDNKDKVDMHKETIKMINKDTNDQIATFAKDKEVAPADVKAAYKYYIKRHESGEEANDDYFTLCALIDLAADDEEGKEE